MASAFGRREQTIHFSGGQEVLLASVNYSHFTLIFSGVSTSALK
jgi:hypothetical protein